MQDVLIVPVEGVTDPHVSHGGCEVIWTTLLIVPGTAADIESLVDE